MAVRVLTDCAVYIDDYDFTTDVNEARLEMTADVKDKTTFGSSGWREKIAGLRSVTMDLKGFWQSAVSQAVDPESFPTLGTADRIHTLAPIEQNPPDPAPFTDETAAFVFRGADLNYKIFDKGIGEIYPFELQAQNSREGALKGILVKPKGTVSATGKLGVTYDTLGFGIAAGQTLYVPIHVFAVGTTITFQVQSDDNTGFTTPTTHSTVGPITTVGGQWASVAGPQADRYWRINVSAITGTFTVAAAMVTR